MRIGTHIYKDMMVRIERLSIKGAFVALLLALLVCVGCRRSLEEEASRAVAMVPISIDWSKSTLLVGDKPQGIDYASVWCFPNDGTEPIVTLFEGKSHINGGILYLPEGTYSILVFNEKVFDPNTDGGTKLTNISFRGTGKWSTFEAYAGVNSKYRYKNSKAADLVNKTPPEILAAWSLETFVVTNDMIIRTQELASKNWSRAGTSSKADSELDKLVDVAPLPLTHLISIEAKIARLVKAREITVTVSGAVEGVYLASGQPNLSRVAHPQDMKATKNNWIFDTDNPANGRVKSNMLVFGLDRDNVDLRLDILLVNDEMMPVSPEFDVTKQVNDALTPDEIVINVGLEDKSDPSTGDVEDKVITLPDVQGGPIDVGDWENEDIILK